MFTPGGDLRQEVQDNSSEEKEEEARDPDPDVEARQKFWSIVGDYVYRDHVAQRTKLYRDKRKRALMYFTRQSSMIIEILLETSHCSVTSFDLLNKNPPEGHMWVRGRLTKKQVTLRRANI